jgi:hypothetical protein
MAARTLSYKDMPLTLRREGASQARKQLRALLANPFLPVDQKASIEARMTHLDNWERGEIKPIPAAVRQLGGQPAPRELPPHTPQNHVIQVGDDVKTDDRLS